MIATSKCCESMWKNKKPKSEYAEIQTLVSMNPLLLATKTEILERQVFEKNTFADEHILAAIESYALQGSPKRRAQDFINCLLPLWKTYSKESYVPLFKDFIEMEFGLESFGMGYVSHVNHVIQEFLFGYNLLLKCPRYLKDFDYETGRQKPDTAFGHLFFSWMAAALFHDVGYDIEKAFEEEDFRNKKNRFWDFMTKRSITDDPITFSDRKPARNLLEKYVFKEIRKIPAAPRFSYTEFEGFFRREIPNHDWVRYDHGVISALKYLTELQKIEKKRRGAYLDWAPNKQATLAMALHNFRYKNVNLQLTSTDTRTFLAYLLIVCDEVQEWERERVDADSELPEADASGAEAIRETELVGICFKPNYAYLVVNHALKDHDLEEAYQKYLLERVVLQKSHLPIRVILAPIEHRPRKEALKKILPSLLVTLLTPGTLGVSPAVLKMMQTYTSRFKRLERIRSTPTQKHLLVPSKPPIYEIYVDHRIDDEPFLRTVFPI